jgi:arylsulfatase A-like enzyme
VRTRRPCPLPAGFRALCSSLVLALLLGCVACTRGEGRAVFLIVVDTLRADRLSSYGYTGHATPGIDSLAERGLRFENAHAAASWTIPSMASVMSARYPSDLGLVEREAGPDAHFQPRERRDQQHFTPPQHVDMLAEHLTEAGFRAAAFVNQPGLNNLDGFLQGFQEWYFPISPHSVASHDPIDPIPPQDWSKVLASAHLSDSALVDRFEEWLGEHGRERVFAWIHLLTPHRPYVGRPASAAGTDVPVTPSDRYDEEIQLVDGMVGRILASIERDAGFSRSTVVFLSDHGEAFGEHGSDEHGHSLHGEVTRVPLILVDPQLEPGQIFSGHVSTLDLLPTLLELVDPGTVREQEGRGTSLVASIAAARPRSPIYTEGMLYGSSERSFIEDGYKLMVDDQAEADLLFELGSDPAERSDVAASQPERTRAMRSRLDAVREQLERSAAAEAQVHARSPTEEEEAAAIRGLRALGYVE